MNRKQIKKVIEATSKRMRKITIFVFVAVLMILSAIALIYNSLNRDDNKYIHYSDKSTLDYRVYYKQNEYFNTYIEKDKQYISSLINKIEADFKYNMTLDEDLTYTYYYYIDAELYVVDSSGKELYKKTEHLIDRQVFKETNYKSFELSQTVSLDYNHYNEIVKGFIEKYNLRNSYNYVALNMYVGINGNCEGYSGTITDNAVISMKIPLTVNTVNVDINYDLSSGKDKKLECIATNPKIDIAMATGIILIIADLLLIAYIVYYIIKTKSPLTVYNRELKKIFDNYGRYISKVKKEIDYDKFQIVTVEQFDDLFEARNSTQSPILFTQNADKTKSIFVVPTNSGIIYIYYLTIGKNRVVTDEAKEIKEEFTDKKEQK